MKKILKTNLKKIIIYFAVLFMIIISICFSSFIDECFYKLIHRKNHIIANDKLSVHFINVGQADAVAINFPNGDIALIDTGSVYSANYLIKYLDTYVMPLGDGDIDYLFFSHADSDHTGGIKSILYNYKVKNVVRPRQYAEFESLTSVYDTYFEDKTGEYERTMHSVYDEVENGCNLIKAEDLLHFEISGANIDIYYPEIIAEESNNFSYFIKVEYKDNSLLFTGDADEELENEIVKSYAECIDCDILKVAHHGSNTSSSKVFLNTVTPKYAVISVGKNNYGHPASVVIENLYESGVKRILRTDKEGNILFAIDKDISIASGYFYLSKVEIGYFQFAWCIVFILVCYAVVWCLKTFKYLVAPKIKHN